MNFMCRAAILSPVVFLGVVSGILADTANAKRRCVVKGKPAPDLVIITEGTEIKWSGKCNAVSPKIVGSVTIKNVGRGPSSKSKKPIVTIWDDQNDKCKVEGPAGKVLQPGEKLTVEVKACRFIAGQNLDGKRNIKIQVDKSGEVAECNERNNTWPGQFEINVKCTPRVTAGKHHPKETEPKKGAEDIKKPSH